MKTTGIVAFTFGTPHSIRSNERISLIASVKARSLHLPVYTELYIRCKPDIDVTYTTKEPGKP